MSACLFVCDSRRENWPQQRLLGHLVWHTLRVHFSRDTDPSTDCQLVAGMEGERHAHQPVFPYRHAAGGLHQLEAASLLLSCHRQDHLQMIRELRSPPDSHMLPFHQVLTPTLTDYLPCAISLSFSLSLSRSLTPSLAEKLLLSARIAAVRVLASCASAREQEGRKPLFFYYH